MPEVPQLCAGDLRIDTPGAKFTRALSAHDAACQPTAALQYLPDYDDKYGGRSRWQQRLGPDAVGSHSVVVEKEGQGNAGDI
jgi:hypothetical protein